MGFAIPGVLDPRTGTVELLTNFTPEWAGFPLKTVLQERLGAPGSIPNMCAPRRLRSSMWGAGRGLTDFICIAIGTGIGGGLVLDGALYLGSRGAAGEIGHQTIVPDGPRCNCGNRGCLEALASGYAIAREAREAILHGDSELADLAGSRRPDPHEVTLAAHRGSEGAKAIYEQAGTYIGRALGNLVCVLNPQAVVVGGGIAKAGELLLAPMRAEIERRTVVFTPERGGVAVLASPLGGSAGAMGAAGWSMKLPSEVSKVRS